MTSSHVYQAAVSPTRRAVALWVILAAQLMLQMDFLIVIVALPRIQQDFGFSGAGLSWVPNAFALAFGGLLLLGGRLGDMVGQVRAFRLGLIIFVSASLLGGLATTAPLLIIARLVQGVGAALAGPSVLALITVMARDDAERAKGMSLFIAVSSIGASAGLILGGALTDYLSWRWSLLINVPVGIVIATVIGRLTTETNRKPAQLDLGGALTSTLGSSSLVFGFIHAAESGWMNVETPIIFGTATALFALFYLIQMRHCAPLLDLRLLRNRQRNAGLIVMALIVAVHASVLFTLIQYLQRVLGLAPFMAGLAYVPLTVTVFAVNHFVPRLVRHLGHRLLLIIGSALVAMSLLLFALINETSSYILGVLLPLLVHALGISLVFAPGTMIIMRGVPNEHAGSASGLLQMDQQIGGALGIAVIAAISAMSSKTSDAVTGQATAFIAAAVIALVAAAVAFGTDRVSQSGRSTKA